MKELSHAVEMTASEKRKVAGAAWRISNQYHAELNDIERRLVFALSHANETFNPAFGMPLDAYRQLCLNNAIRHVCRGLKPVAQKERMTAHLDDAVCGEWTLGDMIAERRNGPEHSRRTIAIHEWLDGLSGLSWLVALANLCGFRFSEIARKIGVPRSSFDRQFGGIFAALREEVANA